MRVTAGVSWRQLCKLLVVWQGVARPAKVALNSALAWYNQEEAISPEDVQGHVSMKVDGWVGYVQKDLHRVFLDCSVRMDGILDHDTQLDVRRGVNGGWFVTYYGPANVQILVWTMSYLVPHSLIVSLDEGEYDLIAQGCDLSQLFVGTVGLVLHAGCKLPNGGQIAGVDWETAVDAQRIFLRELGHVMLQQEDQGPLTSEDFLEQKHDG